MFFGWSGRGQGRQGVRRFLFVDPHQVHPHLSFRIRQLLSSIIDRIQHFSWVPVRIRIQGFGDRKLEKIYSWKNHLHFWSKIAINLSLDFHI